MRRSFIVFIVASVASFVSYSTVAADTIVPGSLAAAEGNINNSIPFNFAFAVESMRYQQVYAAAEFGISPLLISGITFRPDGNPIFGPPFSMSYDSVQIDLSTTSNAPDGLSSTFAANVGADDMIVRSGPLSLSSSASPGPGGTRAFDIAIPFSSPFVYNPLLGNLLVDIRVIYGTFDFGSSFDAHLEIGDSISRVLAFDVDSPTAAFNGNDTLGLVTEFQTQPINPVPDAASSLSLLLIGVSSVMGAHRWLNRT